MKKTKLNGITFDEAVTLFQSEKYIEANAILRHLLITNPDDVNIRNMLGLTECRIGSTGMGIRILERLSEIHPDMPDIRTNLQNWTKERNNGPYKSTIANSLHAFCEKIGDKDDSDETILNFVDEIVNHIYKRPWSKANFLLNEVAKQITFSFKNFNFNSDTNGERHILAKLVPFGPRVILDVGANIGDWSILATLYHPQAEIHAFEIVPKTREKLLAAVEDLPNVKIHNYGLADRDGEIDVRYCYEFDQGSSIITAGGRPHEIIRAPVKRGETFAETNGISKIDFLKIDAEGAEHLILDGFKGFFADGKIDLVQFEYGRASVTSRFLLKDYHDFFKSHDMSVGKVYPEGVMFFDYLDLHEDFLGPNYIACSNRRPDLMNALDKMNNHANPF